MSKHKPLEDIVVGWKKFTRPTVGQMFRHYKGSIYEIVTTGFLEDSGEPCVIYRSLENEIVWVRTAKNFFETVDYQGKQQPRFEKIV